MRRLAYMGLVGLFLVVIATPPLLALRGGADASAENRRLAAFPTLATTPLRAFPQAFERWYDDHFGLRDTLVRGYNRLKVLGLGVSTRSGVALGEDGWLFYGGGALTAHRGVATLPEDYKFAWQHYLEGKRDWLEARGIHYLMVIAANKLSIYDEHLRFNRVGEPPLTQLMTHMTAHSDLAILDLRPPLLAAKGQGELYRRTDSHWNALGAYHGYRAIMTELARWRPELAPRPLDDFDIERRPTRGGDLAGLLNLTDDYRDETVTLTPKYDRCSEPVALSMPKAYPWGDHQQVVASHCPQAPPLTAVVLRDSFSKNLIPLLQEHFRRIVFVEQLNVSHPLSHSFPLLAYLVATEHPDLVIDQIVERKLLSRVPYHPQLVAASLQHRFMNSKRKRAGMEGITTQQGAPLGRNGVRVRTDDQWLNLKGVATPQGEALLLGMKLVAPAQTTLTLTPWNGADPQTHIQARLQPGPNILILPLPGTDPEAGWRLQPGTAAGRYLIQTAEIRGVSSPLPGAPVRDGEAGLTKLRARE